jgi:hypothetical protein
MQIGEQPNLRHIGDLTYSIENILSRLKTFKKYAFNSEKFFIEPVAPKFN